MTSIEWVAEIGSNHNGDFARAAALIDKAAEIGCTAVKFQLFKADKLYVSPDSETKRRELDDSWLDALCQRAHGNGLLFGVTPFDVNAVAAVMTLVPDVDFLKVSSYSLLDMNLLAAVCATFKPVMLSTGMATLSEAFSAIQALDNSGPLTVLHCVSGYPTPANQANLRVIPGLKSFRDGCRVGFSDHTRNAGVLYRAIHHYGADVIEAHLDIDGSGWEFADHCWLPRELGDVITAVADGFKADGDGIKDPQQCEYHERRWRSDPVDGLRPMLETRTSS